MNGSGAAGICSLACGIRANLGQSVRSLLSKRSTGLFRFALQTVCSPPGRGERYGQAVARGHSRAIRGPQLLSTPGQRHLSDVQANDACLIMHPVWSRGAQAALPVLPLEWIARPPKGGVVAPLRFARPSGRFPVSLGMKLSRFGRGKSV